VVVGDSSVRLAVLIDAENVQLAAVEPLLTEIARFGTAQVRRAYGDWTGGLKSWKDTLLAHAIQPVQQFAAVKRKNAADIALVIDAMDLLHSGAFDAFCLVSSDSDFTRLAERIRESGLTVHGFGERKTNRAFVAACDTFVYVEDLLPESAASATAPRAGKSAATGSPASAVVPTQLAAPAPSAAGTTPATAVSGAEEPSSGTTVATPSAKKKKKSKTVAAVPPPRATTADLLADTALVARIREAVAANAGPDGWTHLSAVGDAIRKRPAIVLKTYGYARLKDLVAATDLFEIQERGNSKAPVIYVRGQQSPRAKGTATSVARAG
jgi:hypothetical protein